MSEEMPQMHPMGVLIADGQVTEIGQEFRNCMLQRGHLRRPRRRCLPLSRTGDEIARIHTHGDLTQASLEFDQQCFDPVQPQLCFFGICRHQRTLEGMSLIAKANQIRTVLGTEVGHRSFSVWQTVGLWKSGSAVEPKCHTVTQECPMRHNCATGALL
jgi:hypothetical protein